MAGYYWELESGKSFATTTTVLVVVSLLLALTCMSGSEAAPGSAPTEEQAVAIGGNSKESWEPKLRANGGFTRLRSNSCTIQPSACVDPRVPGNACCGDACFDLDSNPWNCGKCNNACQLGRVCCSGKCKNLNRDKHNCGSCKSKCPDGASCSFGLCGY